MPIYTYECPKCGYRQDYMEPISSPSVDRACPAIVPVSPEARGIDYCDGTMRRIPSIPAPAVFKCSMPTYQKPKKSK